MRFKNLKEADDQFYDDLNAKFHRDWTEWFGYVETIKRDCQPYLQQVGNDAFGYGGYPMYRGINTKSVYKRKIGKFHKLNARLSGKGNFKPRKPKNTGRDLHNTINDFFMNKFGIPFRDGVFASGVANDASFYGVVYQMFPIGDFKFAWSDKIHDLYSDIGYIEKDQRNLLETYQTTDLKSAISSGHEIMLWVDSYYVMWGNQNKNGDVLNAFQEILDR